MESVECSPVQGDRKQGDRKGRPYMIRIVDLRLWSPTRYDISVPGRGRGVLDKSALYSPGKAMGGVLMTIANQDRE